MSVFRGVLCYTRCKNGLAPIIACAGRSYKFEEVKEAINECNRAGRGAKVFLEG